MNYIISFFLELFFNRLLLYSNSYVLSHALSNYVT